MVIEKIILLPFGLYKYHNNKIIYWKIQALNPLNSYIDFYKFRVYLDKRFPIILVLIS